MGFGLLILGYFLTFAFNLAQAYFFADVIGALVMLYAFSKLSEYNRYFRWAAVCGILFTLAALTNGILITMRLLEGESSLDILLEVLKAVTGQGVHWCMFQGIRGIASGAECDSIVTKATRNQIMTMMYYAMFYVTVLVSPWIPEIVSYVSFIVYLYFLVCLVFNLLLIHRCFGMLYPAEGDPMENRRSRLPFLNKIYDAFDKVEEEKNRYRKESMEMAWEEAGKRAAEKKGKNGKGKKKKKKK